MVRSQKLHFEKHKKKFAYTFLCLLHPVGKLSKLSMVLLPFISFNTENRNKYKKETFLNFLKRKKRTRNVMALEKMPFYGPFKVL